MSSGDEEEAMRPAQSDAMSDSSEVPANATEEMQDVDEPSAQPVDAVPGTQSTQPFPTQSLQIPTQQTLNATQQSLEQPIPQNAQQNSSAENVPRLAIQRLQLENFKSFGGVVNVGPFHKSFSSIVGPNGSGKSNVIDAMLFIFGRRAKQLRHSKLSELLHHSATVPNVTSATVTVFFHEIVDTGNGDDDYDIVPDSQFSVARTAFRNNTSKYFLNEREVKMADIIKLLKSKGVDLDNNRFLILQGEVEQIAMMKPKAVNAHEDGLLEYLEDIIGSNRHIERIEASAALVESLNEERSHKLNRVKAAERERDALESAKEEAVDYIDKEREVLTKTIQLFKARQFEKFKSLEKHLEEEKEAKGKLENFGASVKEKETALKELEKTFHETQRNSEIAVKTMNEAKDKYSVFERKDIKLREDIKALKAKQKKLAGLMSSESARAQESIAKRTECLEEKENAEERIEDVENELQKAQQEFDTVRDKVKAKTAPIREELEKKQQELLPYSETVNECKREVQVAQSELQLLVEKLEAPSRNLEEAEKSLGEMEECLGRANQLRNTLKEELASRKRDAAANDEEIRRKRQALQELSVVCSDMRRKVEEARMAKDDASTRSRLHNAILSASRSRRLRGIVGRLGDLASVDSKYATAVGAAAGASLDCIVVQTAEDAQEAIKFLRQENLGRATFVILDKVDYLRSRIDRFSHSDRRADGPRLFDYLEIPDRNNRTALYYALHDTLVAGALEEARRMAFKPTRLNRVVTLSGELIESSGAMTGGGRGPTRYRLGSGRSNDGQMSAADFKDLCERLEATKLRSHEEEAALRQLEQNHTDSSSRAEELETQITRANLEVTSLEERITYMNHTTLPARRKAVEESEHAAQTPDAKRRRELEKKVKSLDRSLEKANAQCEGLESKISELQEKIVAAGGKKFEDAKKALEACRSKLSELQSIVSKSTSRASAAEKAAEKASEASSSAEAEIEKVKDEINQAREQSEAMLDDAESVLKKFKEAEVIHEEWVEKVHRAQKEHASVKEDLKKLRREEVSLEDAAKAVRQLVQQENHELQALKQKEKSMTSKLEKLSLLSLDLSPEETEDQSNNDSPPDSMEIDTEERAEDLESHQLSSQERKKLSAEISILESQQAELNPNLSAIDEYKTKDVDYRNQVDELDELTRKRDAGRKECDTLRKSRLDEFMAGYSTITLKLKELYQMITLGGDAELELVDSLDPFSEGIMFSVRPPKKSWKNISNLSGGEKTLSSLALVFALHYFKPTPLYFLDEIDAALDYKNVSIVANYVKERTKNAQFIIISLRNNMFELADRLVGIYKTHNTTKSVTIDPKAFVMPQLPKPNATVA